jgi:hypothetical protein
MQEEARILKKAPQRVKQMHPQAANQGARQNFLFNSSSCGI